MPPEHWEYGEHMGIPRRTVTLRFQTDRSGTGPFMWGQIALWDVLEQLPANDTSLNGLGRWTVPEGRDLDDVLAAIRALIERHDSLRTRFHDTPDGLVQELADSGELAVDVHDVGSVPADEADAVDEATALIGERLRDIPFDNALDLPLRVAVVTRHAAPVTVLMAVSHLAIDGWSGRIVREDLADLLAQRTLPAPGQQPLERAAYEGTDLARSREARALNYWSRQLTEIPTCMIESANPDRQPDFTWSKLESPAVALAARSLSLRTGVEAGIVVLGATAALLATYKGEQEAAVRLLVSTRFQPATRRLVGAFNQNALFRIGIAARSDGAYEASDKVEHFLLRTQEAALRAFCHCECDPRKLEAMVNDIATRRGVAAGGYCFFNDIRLTRPERTGAVDPGAAADALPETRITAPEVRNSPTSANFFLYLNALEDQAVLTLGVDDGFLIPGTAASFLADLERLLTRAATEELSMRTLCADLR